MPELTRDGVSVHYETEGAGPPLMLIPGMLSDGTSWLPVVAPLAERFTVILPDPRGAGQTRRGDGEITLAALAGDMLALADHLGHARLAVAGHSMGALVALTMAAQAPERLSHLVGLASTPRPSARLPFIFETLCTIRAQAGEPAFFEALFPWLFHDAFFWDRDAVAVAVQAGVAYPHKQSLEAMRHQVRALGRLDLKSMAAQLEMPALALLAQEDALIAPEAAQQAWSKRGARTEILDGCGHSLHWDQPETVAARITDFLTGE